MAGQVKLSLSLISFNTGPVNARPPPFRDLTGRPTDVGFGLGPATVATHIFADAPSPRRHLCSGGAGNFALEQANNYTTEDFLTRRID